MTAGEDLLYLKDTTGNRQADIREVVFTGFDVSTSYGLANTLQWGLDHKIYGATSHNHRSNPRRPDRPKDTAVSLAARGFRFDPVGLEIEPVSGVAEFGNAFDNWGNRFICDNQKWIVHPVLPNRYLELNPHFATDAVQQLVALEGDEYLKVYPASRPEPWRVLRETLWKANNSGKWEVPHGFLTAGSGVAVYRGSVFPAPYQGNVFIGEVSNNLVRRLVLHPQGVTFTARMGQAAREFLTSTDNWFRPVNLANGPDGGLYVADMYREIIETESIITGMIQRYVQGVRADEILAQIDVHAGRDRGRIYRIVPLGFERPAPQRLVDASSQALVALLEDPNGWVRETAQRLLYERQDRSVVGALRMLFDRSKRPEAQLHALYALEGLGALDKPTLLRALEDASAPVRKHAIRLSEERLRFSPTLLTAVLACARDPAAPVRFQTALSLSGVPDTVRPLAQIIRRDTGNAWTRRAVLAAAAPGSISYKGWCRMKSFSIIRRAEASSSDSLKRSERELSLMSDGRSWLSRKKARRTRHSPLCGAWETGSDARGDRSRDFSSHPPLGKRGP